MISKSLLPILRTCYTVIHGRIWFYLNKSNVPSSYVISLSSFFVSRANLQKSREINLLESRVHFWLEWERLSYPDRKGSLDWALIHLTPLTIKLKMCIFELIPNHHTLLHRLVLLTEDNLKALGVESLGHRIELMVRSELNPHYCTVFLRFSVTAVLIVQCTRKGEKAWISIFKRKKVAVAFFGDTNCVE